MPKLQNAFLRKNIVSWSKDLSKSPKSYFKLAHFFWLKNIPIQIYFFIKIFNFKILKTVAEKSNQLRCLWLQNSVY